MPRFNSLRDWLAWQESLHPRTIDLGLERVHGVARALGVDTLEAPVITVGGTNGKGSAVAMLDSIVSASGYRVGAFTSPHLFRYNERIRIAGRAVDDEALVAAFERIDAARGDTSLTFFEFNTLAALLVFGGTDLDLVVLEVGLGGRLDAVNLVDADVALLMSVDLDHMDWLGDSLAEIGREKAGIFRRGRPAVLGREGMPESVTAAARAAGAKLRVPPVDFGYEISTDGWNWRGRSLRIERLPQPALTGMHQLANAAAVLAALEALGAFPLRHDAVAEGLRRVRLQGRFEIVPGDVEWIFDVAHNPAAAAMLGASLAARKNPGRTIAVAGILDDKDAAGMIKVLAPHVDQWIAADLPGPRGMTADKLVDLCARNDRAGWSLARSVAEACELAERAARPGDRVLVFGSFHTVGPALEWRARRQ